MRHRLLHLILLTTVALSSSNIILNSDATRRLISGQYNDNILIDDNTINKIICDNNDIRGNDEETINLCRILKLKNTDNNRVRKKSFDNIDSESEVNYNDKGFRKEQWHNYPRQLDRLQEFFYEIHKPGNTKNREMDETNVLTSSSDADDDERILGLNDGNLNVIRSNEVLIQDNNDDIHNVYDSIVASTNPMLFLKIRLACLGKSLATNNIREPIAFSNIPELQPNEANKIASRENNIIGIDSVENPSNNIIFEESKRFPSLQRFNYLDDQSTSDQTMTHEMKSVPIKKRIFSLWSRLQSLTPKGHELHHRRHLHAFYGMPGPNGSGGIVTAETRALVRPPGSPLRWG